MLQVPLFAHSKPEDLNCLGDVELVVAVRDPVRVPPSFDKASKAVRATSAKRPTPAKRRK